jgi:D-arabinan endo alpha-(1,5)-arabinofuranosidase
MRRLPLERCDMSATLRSASLSVASAAAIGLIAAIGLAPPATATPCSAPEANVPPRVAPPAMPAPAPVVQPPTGRRPSNANDHAPLPKLGPLISSLLRPNSPGTRYSAPLQPQAEVVPPGPNPPAPGVPQPPNATQLRPNAAPVPPQPAPQPPPPPPASIAGAPTSLVDFVTGPNSPNKTLERFGISGTDLGIAWDNGDPANRQVLMAFGDTFGYCSVHGQQWRYNTLFRSSDHDLSHGIHVADGVPNDRYSGSPVWATGLSKQVVNTIHRASHETGIIPTAAISVGRTQYMNFMSIRQWGRDGEWSTNYSAIARSIDNGQNWGIYPGTIRAASADAIPGVGFTPGNENFQMGAFMRGNDGYLYSFGTPSGRGGAAYLSRVPMNFVPDLTKYQYWNGDGGGRWVPNNPGAATPLFPGPVGEMSAQYNSYLKQYLVLYTNGGSNDVVARTAPAPQGPWSPEQPLVSSFQVPGGIYAPMIHPWSSGKDLYFNLSLWSAYDVMLMHTVLP